MAKRILFAAVLIYGLILQASAQKLAKGIWRGALATSSNKEIPFNFEVTDTAGNQLITIFNASERFKVTAVTAKR